MVFEVYLEGKNEKRYTVLDIEYYLKQSEYTKNWISCIKVSNIVDGIALFVKKKTQENPNYNVLQFITDTNAVRDLEYWLMEQSNNRWTELKLASPRHYERIELIRKKVYEYAEKYDLKVNED